MFRIQPCYIIHFVTIGKDSARNSENTLLQQKGVETAFPLSRRYVSSILNIMVVKISFSCFIMILIFVKQKQTFKTATNFIFQRIFRKFVVILLLL